MEDRRWADQAFEEFWTLYPRKVGKRAAKREWDRIRPDAVLFDKMKVTLGWQLVQWDDPQFIPHPRTWLHQGRWDDEPIVAIAKRPTKNQELMRDNAAAMADLMGKRNGRPH